MLSIPFVRDNRPDRNRRSALLMRMDAVATKSDSGSWMRATLRLTNNGTATIYGPAGHKRYADPAV